MEKDTRTDELIKVIKNNKVFSTLIVFCITVIGVGSFTESIDAIISFGEKRFQSDNASAGPSTKRIDLAAAYQENFDTDELTVKSPANENLSRNNITNVIDEVIDTEISFHNNINTPNESDMNSSTSREITVEESPPEKLAIIDIQTPTNNQPELEVIQNETDTIWTDRVLEDINRRYKFANSIPLSSVRDTSLLAVAKLAADKDYFETSITIANDMRYSSSKSEGFAYIARSAHLKNQFEHAFEAASLIPYSSIKSEIMSEIATTSNNTN